ncbi:MAG: hypothetical protein QM635_11430 [Microbacteriaceae bacterium]
MTSFDTVVSILRRDDMPPVVFPGGADVRATDPLTSHAARDGVDPAASRDFVIAVLQKHGPLADFEIVEFARRHGVPFADSRIRTARHELVEAGVVEATGYYHVRRRPARQTLHTVWGLVEEVAA